jgi:hypothetical protein
MDWNALAAAGQLVSALAVLITLVYLARQVRQLNRQDLLNAYRHTYDSLNEWAFSISATNETSDLILRGRQSYGSLSEPERFRFDHLHLVLLNNIESHFYQVQKTSMDEAYRRWAIENVKALVRGYLDHPGTREFWRNAEQYYEPGIRKLIEETMGAPEASSS